MDWLCCFFCTGLYIIAWVVQGLRERERIGLLVAVVLSAVNYNCWVPDISESFAEFGSLTNWKYKRESIIQFTFVNLKSWFTYSGVPHSILASSHSNSISSSWTQVPGNYAIPLCVPILHSSYHSSKSTWIVTNLLIQWNCSNTDMLGPWNVFP